MFQQPWDKEKSIKFLIWIILTFVLVFHKHAFEQSNTKKFCDWYSQKWLVFTEILNSLKKITN